MYEKWLEDHYGYLYDIYHTIILPNQVSAKLSFKQFCKFSYDIHHRRVRGLF
jgi:hypothetical protein